MPLRHSERATRGTDPTYPVAANYPIRDDGVPGHWLVAGDLTRGQAIAYVAQEDDIPFVKLRAVRVYMRWEGGSMHGRRCWELSDGVLLECERTHPEADRLWEVDRA